MKEKKKYKKAFRQIKKAISKKDGLLKPLVYTCNQKPMMKGEFPIGDNDELMFNISCLLKTCVLALEGDASFSSPALSNANPKSNVIVSLEFIINLLPREQMVVLDEIHKILSAHDQSKM